MHPSCLRPGRSAIAGLHRVALAALLISLSAISVAQTGAGSITGSVRNDETKAFLEGAEVTLIELGRRVFTDRDGSFTFGNIPTGTHTVRVFYTGLDVVTERIQVGVGPAPEVKIRLRGETYQLGAFTVSADREGNAASITRQRVADNVKNVVSTDAFGSVPDGNIGNFLVRLPGVTGNNESGEVTSIGVRGTPPDVNTLTVDGLRMGNALAGFLGLNGERAPTIDHIPAEFVKEVELSKAPRPEDPVESIGGTINLITKSALDFDRNLFTYRAGVAHNLRRPDLRPITPNLALSYFTRLRQKRDIGMAVSLSYSDAMLPGDRVDMQRVEPDGRNTQARTLAWEVRRVRMGSGLKFDYKLGEHTTTYLKLQYNFMHTDRSGNELRAGVTSARRVADYSRVSRAQIETGVVPRTTANETAGVAPGFSEGFTELLAAAWSQVADHTNTHSRYYVAEVGATSEFRGNQKLTFKAAYSPSHSDARFAGFTATMANPIGMAIDTSGDRRRPIFTQTYGPRVDYGSDFNLYTATYGWRPETTKESIWNLKLDYAKGHSLASYTGHFKAGVHGRRQNRTGGLRGGQTNYRYGGPDTVSGLNATTRINDDNIRQFVFPEPGHRPEIRGSHPWPEMDKIDINAVNRVFAQNPGWFIQTALGVPDSSEITEDVSAAYLQDRIQIGNLSLLGGVRFEETEVDATGRITDARNPGVTRVSRQKVYKDFFPSFHARYDLRAGWVARASYSSGMGRPRLAELYPVTTVSYGAAGAAVPGTVQQNNPGLRPQYTENIDASLEYYFEPAGMLSVGFFNKKIKDYLYRTITEIGFGADNGFDGDYEGFNLSTTTNGGGAKIKGIEINYNQTFVMLPKPFNGLGITANYTKLKATGTFAEGVTELGGFVPETINGAITFRWKKMLSRAAASYSSAYLRSRTAPSGSAASADVWNYQWYQPLFKVDLSVEYSISDRYRLFIDAINVGDRWLTWFTGPNSTHRTRVRIVENYGARLNAGISGRF
jgi:iron complex outermembrane receptor protein